ncbi:MAG: hypothetical protein N2578_02450, partial [Bdellovibrionaceae bacterium]|nr:hypothetical protein [Pseudobdellovibrionaceae bacterium]
MMAPRWLAVLTFLSFCALSLYIVVRGGQPLCINSRVVQSLDITGTGGPALVAENCALTTNPPRWSEELSFYLKLTEIRLSSLEGFLSRYGTVRPDLKIHFRLDRPWLIHYRPGHLFIGEEALRRRGALEREIIRHWLLANARISEPHGLGQESIVDLIYYAWTGQSPVKEGRIPMWPTFLLSRNEYCLSPWVRSEDLESCVRLGTISLSDSEIVDRSLRPIITGALIETWDSSTLAEKFSVLRAAFYRKLDSANPEGVFTPFDEARLALTLVRKGIGAVSEDFRQRMGQVLLRSGYTTNDRTIRLDLMVEVSSPLTEKSVYHRVLGRMLEKKSGLRIAVSDQNKIWFLPGSYSIPIEGKKMIYARNVLVEKCGDFDLSWVLGYEGRAARVLVFDGCSGRRQPDLTAFVFGGTEAFARENPDLPFIQFHIPSLGLKKEELPLEKPIFESLRARERDQQIVSVLGWQELDWIPMAKVYKPRAYVGAVSYTHL